MRGWVVYAALAAGLTPAPAGAQSISLSEADALARLSPSSPRVRAIRADIDLARADVLAAGRWPNPRMTFDRESAAGVTEDMTMVAQALPITGRRGFDVRAASALADARANRADEAVRRARADLRLAFSQLVVAQIRERELIAARDRLQGLAELLATREAAGDAAGFDRLRAEREVLDIDADRASASTDRARAQSAVAAFFADEVDPSRLVAVDGAAARTALPLQQPLIERAVSTRGELLALAHDVDAAKLAGRAAERRRIPEPEIVVGTKSSTAAGGDLGSVVTVHASIPLFDRSRAEKALADARAAQAEARADLFRQTLRAEIAALRATVVERRETADRYRAAAVNSAHEIERIAQLSYEAGERSILELLDAYRIGSAARVRQALLDAAVRQAEIELEFVSGWEIPS
jgi:cobalt-zinc-cadmium efflux system outer membrane protein